MADRKSAARLEARAPMGIAAHEGDRAAQGRTTTTRTPVHVRNMTSDATLDEDWLRERLGFKLGKFAIRIDRVDVVLRDEAGPTGAPTVRTTIQLHGSRHNPTTVTARAATAQAAVSTALRSAERSFRRDIERSRAKRKT